MRRARKEKQQKLSNKKDKMDRNLMYHRSVSEKSLDMNERQSTHGSQASHHSARSLPRSERSVTSSKHPKEMAEDFKMSIKKAGLQTPRIVTIFVRTFVIALAAFVAIVMPKLNK